MGHNIEYYEYPESVDKNKVYSELGTMVHYRCIQEGGRLSAIRWLESSAPILMVEMRPKNTLKRTTKAGMTVWLCDFIRKAPKNPSERKTQKSNSISSTIDWRSRSLLRIFRVQKPSLSVAKAVVLEFPRHTCLRKEELPQTNALYVDAICDRRRCLQRRKKSERICRNAAKPSLRSRKSVRFFVKCAGL